MDDNFIFTEPQDWTPKDEAILQAYVAIAERNYAAKTEKVERRSEDGRLYTASRPPEKYYEKLL